MKKYKILNLTTGILLNLLLSPMLIASELSNNFGIAIHGGAGTIAKSKMTKEKETEYKLILKKARDAGYEILKAGGTSKDAVLAAIVIMEDSPLFNAGIGAVYTYEGVHELDASVMDGKDRNAGAVASVRRIKNPILLAQDVMTSSVHVMLSGGGAEQFAKQMDYKLIDNELFNTERRYRSLLKAKEKMNVSQNWFQHEDYRYGTVGAVAVDKNGDLFAGTSTGGMTAKRWGRIGDAPIIGAGTFADNNSCAVSATGHGEYFIRYQVASDICAQVAYKGVDIKTAGDNVIFGPMFKAGGTGGVIIIDRKANIHMPFNTSGMYRAAKNNCGVDEVLIFPSN